MELLLSNPKRGIRPDQVEKQVIGNLIRCSDGDVRESDALSIISGGVQSPFVDIDTPNSRLRGFERECERERAPPATYIQKMTGGRGLRGIFQKDSSACIEAIRAKCATRTLHCDGMVAES